MNEKLTAYALNELPPDERAAVEALLKRDPELQGQADEISAFCTLLEREITRDGDTLMPGQRAQLMQHFQSTRGNGRPLWRRPAFLSTIGFAAAACLAVMLTVQQMKRPEPVVVAAAAPATELRKNPVGPVKAADETFAGRVTLKAAVADKKEVSKPQRPAPAPAAPFSQAADDLIAATTPPMPALQDPSRLGAAADRRNATQVAGGAVQIPKDPMDLFRSVPAPQLGGGTIANLSQSAMKDGAGLNQAGSGLDDLIAASSHAGIDGVRGLNLSNPGSQTQGIMINSGNPESQGQYAARGSPVKPDADASGIDLSARIAARSGLGISGTGAFAQEGPTFANAFGSNTIHADAAIDNVIAERKQSACQLGSLSGNPAVDATGMALKGGGLLTDSIAASSGARQFHVEEQTIHERMAGAETPGASGTGGVQLNGNRSIGGAALPGSDTTSLVKSRAGTLILNGGNTYTETTIVSGGTPQVQQNMQNAQSAIEGQSPASNAMDRGDKDRLATGNTGAQATMGGKPAETANSRTSNLPSTVVAATIPAEQGPATPNPTPAPLKIAARDGIPTAGTLSGDSSGSQMSRGTGGEVQFFGSGAAAKPSHAAATPAAETPAATPATLTRQIGEMAETASSESPRRQPVRQLSKTREPETATHRPVIGKPFTSVAQQPFSTFPIEVGTASYANVRRILNSGRRPPPDAVRIEELVNHFPYHDTSPTGDQPIAAHIDFADAPWQPLHRVARVAVKAREVKGDPSPSAPVIVAEDVNLQIAFNPARVAAYRLIGYDTQSPVKDDHNMDQQDAGGVAAGHSVTALYEIVPAGLKNPDDKRLPEHQKLALTPESRTATAPAEPAATGETMRVKVLYKEPHADQSRLLEVAATDTHRKLSESGRDFQFAVSVAEFGMLLRGSPDAPELTWERVHRLALAGKGDDEDGRRAEFIQLIEKARGLFEGRR